MNINFSEYTVIGAGPAGICAIGKLLQHGVAAHQIRWIDPTFSVGDFGGKLSVGSSVPGNTRVKHYREVLDDLFPLILTPRPETPFALDGLTANFVCSLSVAAEPLQFITHQLRVMVHAIQGTVCALTSVPAGWQLTTVLMTGEKIIHSSKKVIVATGAIAKTLDLTPFNPSIKMLDPEVTFIESELAGFLKAHPMIKTVAVVGSSHSAALATMHLLSAGKQVKQFMNKQYRYATPCVANDGTVFTMYDNTGLKGDVAAFTKQLLKALQTGTSDYQTLMQFFIGQTTDETMTLLAQQLPHCDGAVTAIGYAPRPAFIVNGIAISQLSYNDQTTAFIACPRLYGVGIGFPLKMTALSGEVEYAVGISKFWSTLTDDIVRKWLLD